MSNIKRLIEQHNDLIIENDLYKRYINYLRSWYSDHAAPEYEGMEPIGFNEFSTNEAVEMCTYKVEVEINDASHEIQRYETIIEVTAPTYMTAEQLKHYIDLVSPYSIEDRVEPEVDINDAVLVEIRDYTLTILEIKEEK